MKHQTCRGQITLSKIDENYPLAIQNQIFQRLLSYSLKSRKKKPMGRNVRKYLRPAKILIRLRKMRSLIRIFPVHFLESQGRKKFFMRQQRRCSDRVVAQADLSFRLAHVSKFVFSRCGFYVRDIAEKVRQTELSFFYPTQCLDHFINSTKYHNQKKVV